LNALTFTGATVGTTAEGAVAFVMGVMDGLLEGPDFVVVGVVAGVDPREALDDFIA
tara:strand:- start:1058 stop:1225 length:168 start_codon:yes stop_codon:yes gene_type:complete